jgi:hypothetical protein
MAENTGVGRFIDLGGHFQCNGCDDSHWECLPGLDWLQRHPVLSAYHNTERYGEQEMKKLGRREMLYLLGGTVASTAVLGGAALSNATKTPSGPFPLAQEPFSWKPKKLDPKEIADTAYQGFAYKGYGCGFGVFYGIVGLMGEKYGKPYNEFPFTMLEVGKSGVSNWGTLCGALLGAASALSLFYGRKERDPMIDQLFRWYEVTAFPTYMPAGKAVKFDGELPTSVANSPLCHVSVSRWAHSSGYPAKSKQRSERCARLTSEVASKTWEIIEAKMQGKTVAWFDKAESRKYCGECHDPGKESPIAKGKQDCTSCHSGTEAAQDKFNKEEHG